MDPQAITRPGRFLHRALQEAAARKGVSNAALAATAGVSQRSIRRWKAGEVEPPPRHIAALATAVGVDPEDLYRQTHGETLRYRRMVAGFSLLEIAEMAGISGAHMGRIESGYSPPSPEVAAALQSALGVTSDGLAALLPPPRRKRRYPVGQRALVNERGRRLRANRAS